MIRFVLGLCGYVPASRLEAMRGRAQKAEDRLMVWQQSQSENNTAREDMLMARVRVLTARLAALRAQLPNRDKAGKFTRRI